MEKRIIGVMRDAAFAPGAGYERDSALMRAVADRLAAEGCNVELIGENDLLRHLRQGHIDAAIVMTMARHPINLLALRRIEEQGTRVTNSPQSLENSVRGACVRLLAQAGIPMPRSVVMDAADFRLEKLDGISPCWVKRGDVCTQQEGDIIFCRSDDELDSVIARIMRHTPHSIVFSSHVEGTAVKFYGVTGTGFFSAYNADGQPFVHPTLATICQRAADTLGLEVWGGDCIVDANGDAYIIDFNDWPSFSICRDEAAQAIVKRLTAYVK